MSEPKILLYDIETAPSLVWVWSQYDTNVIDTKEDWYMLCFAYKWLGEEEVHFERKINRVGDDKSLTKKLWSLFDEADATVAHHGDRFDSRKATARFIYHELGPPSPYQRVDTKKIVAKISANYANSLDELSRLLGLGRKLKHKGFELWQGCMTNDPESWAIMEEYNRHDVELLERLYYVLTPWVEPMNFTHWRDGIACRRCGSANLIKRGFHHTNASRFQTWQCKVCKGYTREKYRSSEASMR